MIVLLRINIFTLTLFSGLFCTLPLQADPTSRDIKIENVYSPQLPPSVMTRAVYLTITNSGNRTRTITGIHAVGFQMAHFHLTEVIDELTSMKSLHSLDVKPGQTLIFEPGGLHIMLMKPEDTSTSSSDMPMTLTFANGDAVNFVASVQAVN